MRKNNSDFYLIFLVLIAINIFLWHSILFAGRADALTLSFLNVGQGDSQLIDFSGAQILIDGGKGPQVLTEIAKSLSPGDRYIDLVVMTHPDLDHFGGLIDVLKTYEVGAVITNGRKGTASAYSDFEKVLAEKNILAVVMKAGESVRYGGLKLSVLYPDAAGANSKKVNESGLVLLLENGGLKALYTADIGFETEQKLISRYNLSAQILKVGHHGSKYSSGKGFLEELRPAISVIGVGKNTYGHPTDAALERLANIGSQIFRTDRDGTVKIIFDRGELKVFN